MNISKNKYLVNTGLNYIFRITTMLIAYITIPLTLKYLNTERYGIWQTILTIITWANLTNFGIGNGLRNKVTESFTSKKYETLKKYISSAYLYLTIISVIILIVSCILVSFLNTNVLFKNNTIDRNEIIISFVVVIFSFCLNFVLGLCNCIAYGLHKSALVSFFQVITNVITLIGLIFLIKYQRGNLINISLLYLISNVVTNMIFSIVLFKDKYITPSSKCYDKKLGRNLTSLGIEFFILDAATLMLFSTDNFIVSSFIGVGEVTSYSITTQLFRVISTLFSILLIQLWSAVAEANYKKDYEWLKKAINRLCMLLIPIAVVLLIMIIKFDFITKVWLGKNLSVDKNLVIASSIYVWLICFNGIFVNVQNGMSKVRVQTLASIFCCILNIPIAIAAIKILKLGVLGVMCSNIICILISSIMCSIDVYIKVYKSRRADTYENSDELCR